MLRSVSKVLRRADVNAGGHVTMPPLDAERTAWAWAATSRRMRHTVPVLASSRSVADLRAIADMHGGYRALATHGLFYLGYPPLFAAARGSRALRRQDIALITGTQADHQLARRAPRARPPLDNWSESSNNVRGEVAWTVLREGMHQDGACRGGRRHRHDGHLCPLVAPTGPTVLNVGAEHLAGLARWRLPPTRWHPAVEVRRRTVAPCSARGRSHVRPLARRTSADVRWFAAPRRQTCGSQT